MLSRPRVFLFAVPLALATAVFSQASDAKQETCLNTSPLDCQREQVTQSDLSGRSLGGANFRGAHLVDVKFDDAGMVVSLFDEAELTNVSFRGTDLSGASFAGARMNEVSFASADLTGARFDDALLGATDLVSAFTCMTTMPDETVNNTDCNQPRPPRVN